MQVKEIWREHELCKQGYVELVPVDWVFKYRGTDVSTTADLKNGNLCSLDDLWNDIKENGLFDPLIVRMGRTSRTLRLEAGNHRIQVLKEHGIDKVPVTIEIRDACGPDAPEPYNEGTHNFALDGSVVLPETDVTYAKPSTIFPELRISFDTVNNNNHEK